MRFNDVNLKFLNERNALSQRLQLFYNQKISFINAKRILAKHEFKTININERI